MCNELEVSCKKFHIFVNIRIACSNGYRKLNINFGSIGISDNCTSLGLAHIASCVKLRHKCIHIFNRKLKDSRTQYYRPLNAGMHVHR